MLAHGKSVESINTLSLGYAVTHKALGIRRCTARLPSVRKDGSLPVVLSQEECRCLFATPLNRLLLNDIRLAAGQQPVERGSRKERRQAVQQRLGYFPCQCPACGMDTLVVVEKILPGGSLPYPDILCAGPPATHSLVC
jgi:hypothetical protein